LAADNRTSTRHDVSLAAQLTIDGILGDCTVLNLSLGGALIGSQTRHAMGQRVHISFKVPTIDEPIAVSATVRWIDRTGIGLQFDGLRARDVWALNEYFKQLRP
jgi:Tfp pilus assembly protein PilZ